MTYQGLASPARQRGGLKVLKRAILGPRLVEYEVRADALADPTHVRVLFPSEYGSDPTARYPVLYLLHGGDDDYRSWTDKGGATEATEGLPMIVVMPHAGNGFYSNWVKSGSYGTPQWETYHIRELLPWIDRLFRTVPAREGRALAGLSMGGFGAMSYAARYPDMFVAAAAFSAVLDTNKYTFVPEIATRRDGGTLGAIWGDRVTQAMNWRAHNPWDLAENLRGMSLIVRTRTGIPGALDDHRLPDPVEGIVYHQSLRMHRRLNELGIPHAWHREPGIHDWPYWAEDLRATLPTLAQVFAAPPPALTPFTHTAAESSYSVRGWTVTIARPRMEFSTLSTVHRSGFALTGSGTATVRTAEWYEPNQVYRIAMVGPDEQLTSRVRAGSDGSLTLTLRLGPPGKGRSYTVGATITEDA